MHLNSELEILYAKRTIPRGKRKRTQNKKRQNKQKYQKKKVKTNKRIEKKSKNR